MVQGPTKSGGWADAAPRAAAERRARTGFQNSVAAMQLSLQRDPEAVPLLPCPVVKGMCSKHISIKYNVTALE